MPAPIPAGMGMEFQKIAETDALFVTQPGSLPALLIEIVRSQPAFELFAARRPFIVEHRVPGGIAAAAFDNHVLAEHALKGEPQALRRALMPARSWDGRAMGACSRQTPHSGEAPRAWRHSR